MLRLDKQPYTTTKSVLSTYNELLFHEANLCLRPSYQRGEVWKQEQKEKLIETILNGIPMPLFLLFQHDDQAECIDGQNRLKTIKRFIEQTHPTDDHPQHPFPYRIHRSHTVEESAFYPPSNAGIRQTMQEWFDAQRALRKNSVPVKRTYRFLTPAEQKRFENYNLMLCIIQEPISFEQRQDIFSRWQNGSAISVSDKLKNENHAFCVFAMKHELERRVDWTVLKHAKTHTTSWLFDAYRLVNVFRASVIDFSDVFLSISECRTYIASKSLPFDEAEWEAALALLLPFLDAVGKWTELKPMMKLSMLLTLATLWKTTDQRCLFGAASFPLKVREALLDPIKKQSTLNQTEYKASYLAIVQDVLNALVEEEEAEPDAAAATTVRKQRISKKRKTEVWNRWVGETVGLTKCLCCGLVDITSREFVAGHVHPEKEGGTIDVDNLRPICAACNGSMGARHMKAYMQEYYPSRSLL